VVGVAKQQLQSACEAAQRDKEAAVSRSMQSVQRRASKEALHQVLVPSHSLSSAFDFINVIASCNLLPMSMSLSVVQSTPLIKVASGWTSQIKCHYTACHAFSQASSQCTMAAVQADLKVARAQHAASDAAQRSDEEVGKLRRELDFMKKEKKGLVQRCMSADRDLASSMVSCL